MYCTKCNQILSWKMKLASQTQLLIMVSNWSKFLPQLSYKYHNKNSWTESKLQINPLFYKLTIFYSLTRGCHNPEYNFETEFLIFNFNQSVWIKLKSICLGYLSPLWKFDNNLQLSRIESLQVLLTFDLDLDCDN